MKVDYDAALEVASHEAVIRQAYKDSVGVWTWSVGLTSNSGHKVERYIGKPQTLQHCMDIYVWALQRYAKDVNEAFEGVELTKAQFVAALSFHWNTGGIKRASWVKSFKAGRRREAEQKFMQWKKPPEIIPRRQKECDLFFHGKWSNNGTMTEYTKLTKNSTPVWGSAKKVNVEKELRKAFAQDAVDEETAAEDIPVPPLPKPRPEPAGGLIAIIVEFIVRLFGGRKTS
jgi:lysozyme